METKEPNPEQLYEWFVINATVHTRANREYVKVEWGCVDEPVTAHSRFRVMPDLSNTVLLSVMERTGYKNNGNGQHPITHFKRGVHVYAKPIKLYRAGSVDQVHWTLAPDTITGQRTDVQLSQRDIESITRVTSTSPDISEAVRRMSKTDPELLFRFGIAVGAGVIDKTGKALA